MAEWSEGSVGSGGEAKLPMLESLGTIDLGLWTTAVILGRARGLTSSLKRRLLTTCLVRYLKNDMHRVCN